MYCAISATADPGPTSTFRISFKGKSGILPGTGFCFWRLVRKADSALIGFCGLQPLVVEAKKEVEIGWWLARDCWGPGLATEAASTALRDGFERAGTGRVLALAQPANLTSIRVAKKSE